VLFAISVGVDFDGFTGVFAGGAPPLV